MEIELLGAEFEDIMCIINTIPEQIDAEDLMTLAFSLPLRTKHIESHARAYALLEGREMRITI